MKSKNIIILIFVGILVSLILFCVFYNLRLPQQIKQNENFSAKQLNEICANTYAQFDSKFPGDWNIKDGKMLKGEVQINDNQDISSLLDNFKESTNAYITIFQGDTRIATNIIKPEGKRAIGTRAIDQVINIVINRGQSYTSEAIVFNVHVYTKYIPIKDSSGEIIGMWFAGIPQDKLQ